MVKMKSLVTSHQSPVTRDQRLTMGIGYNELVVSWVVCGVRLQPTRMQLEKE